MRGRGKKGTGRGVGFGSAALQRAPGPAESGGRRRGGGVGRVGLDLPRLSQAVRLQWDPHNLEKKE